MFKTSDELEFGKAGSAKAPRPGDLVCAGEDLKDMLAQLSRQFVEADQRNSHALHEMRGRLETLGRTAESVRDHMPSEYAPAFARIEDGVQHLADRIAAVGRERDIAKATAAMQPLDATADFEPEPAITPTVAVEPRPPVAVAAAAMAFAAPMGQSVAGDAAEPWDRASAEALARLYESGDASLGVAEVVHGPTAALVSAPTSEAQPVLPLVAPVAAAPAADHAAHHADRAWLEERFADIATRVEQSLSEMRPDNALLAFDGRLEQLEHRFSSAMEDVATRSDVEGLRIIEAHISELAGQFEQAQGQLGRLDHIERQIGDLMHQVSDDRFADLFSQIVPMAPHQGPSEDEIEAVAMAVADRVASRMPQPEHAAPALEAGSIGDLKRLVEGFVAGQRETEEHTSTMLDTMQQAMIRMLDRMDALESAPPAYGTQQANFAAPVAQPVMAAPAAVAMPHRAEPTFAPEATEPDTAPETPNLSVGRAAPQNKEDFRAAAVADARRAARKVATQATDAAAPQPENARVRRGAPAVEVHVAEPTVADEKRKPRTPLMVAGIALVVAIGFLAASIGINRGGPVAERQTAQQKQPLTIDNGSVETTAGELPENAPKAGMPTPTIEANGAQPRPAPAAAPRAATVPADPRALPAGKSGAGVQGLSDQQELTGDQQVAPQDAAFRAPGPAPAANAIGIAVTQTNAVANNSDLARMRQQRNMASLASQLAAVQANAPTLPASMMPDHAAGTAAPAADVSTPAEMPPAQIGPISLRTAAQKGDPSAEFEVAARFAEGRGVAQDFKQATMWYSRAAQRGFAPAQYRLGTLFERGIGIKADAARAKIWYGRAAEQGHVKAMHNLAVLNSGREQNADYAMAVHWFTAAAERGLADSQYNLGVLYESGLGLPRDLKQAYHWLSLAARNGDKEAGRRREQIRMKLEQADVAAADAAIETWRAQASDPVVNEARAAGEVWKQRQAASR